MLGLFDIHSEVWTRAAAGLAVIAGLAFSMVFLIHLASLDKGIKSGPRMAIVQYAWLIFQPSADIDEMPYTKTDDPWGVRFKLAWKALFNREKSWVDMQFMLWLKSLLNPSIGERKRSLFSFGGRLVHWFLIFLAGPLIAIISVDRMISANHLIAAHVFSSAGQIALLACWEMFNKYKVRSKEPKIETKKLEKFETNGDNIDEPCQCVQKRKARQDLPSYGEMAKGGVCEETEQTGDEISTVDAQQV